MVKSENPCFRHLNYSQDNNENFEKYKIQSFIIIFNSICGVPTTYIVQGNRLASTGNS